jgi:hypothetical protein
LTALASFLPGVDDELSEPEIEASPVDLGRGR